jgi:hypothetical protein
MQKHKFSIMCPDVLLMDTALGPPEYEKWCVFVSWTGRTKMLYVTRRFERMLHKFGVTCLGALFMEIAPGPPELEKYCKGTDKATRGVRVNEIQSKFLEGT